MRWTLRFGVLLLVAVCTVSTQSGKQKTEKQIRQEIIAASLANYSGNCPCPGSGSPTEQGIA